MLLSAVESPSSSEKMLPKIGKIPFSINIWRSFGVLFIIKVLMQIKEDIFSFYEQFCTN